MPELCIHQFNGTFKGRPWDAIDFYFRALSINPHLPEAICGLMSSLSSICDWRGMGCLQPQVDVYTTENICSSGCAGYLCRSVHICDNQLRVAYRENTRISLDIPELLQVVAYAWGRNLRAAETQHWEALFSTFSNSPDDRGHCTNKGGSLLRFMNWVLPRLQRRWYVMIHGKAHMVNHEVLVNSDPPSRIFNLLAIPRAMTAPSIPAILPFHTVCIIRLILLTTEKLQVLLPSQLSND